MLPGTDGFWDATWQSILVEGIDAANKKEARSCLSVFWDWKDAVEWRAFPTLGACAVRFYATSQAQSAAHGIAGEVSCFRIVHRFIQSPLNPGSLLLDLRLIDKSVPTFTFMIKFPISCWDGEGY